MYAVLELRDRGRDHGHGVDGRESGNGNENDPVFQNIRLRQLQAS